MELGWVISGSGSKEEPRDVAGVSSAPCGSSALNGASKSLATPACLAAAPGRFAQSYLPNASMRLSSRSSLHLRKSRSTRPCRTSAIPPMPASRHSRSRTRRHLISSDLHRLQIGICFSLMRTSCLGASASNFTTQRRTRPQAFALQRQRSHVRIVSGAPIFLYFKAQYARQDLDSSSI